MKTLLYASLLSICLCAYTFSNHKGEIDISTPSSAQFLDADLSLSKSTIALLGTKYGTNVPFNLTITNNSAIQVREVMIEDLVPEGYEFNTGNNPGWAYNPGTRIASYTHFPIIEPGEFAIVTLNLILGPSSDINGWLNRSEILGAIGEDNLPINDTNPDNNKDSVAVEVLDLALKKVQITTPEYTWQQDIDFVITVYNQGNTEATNVEVRDYKPEGYFFDGAKNIGDGWSQVVDTFKNVIPSIPAGGFVEIPLVLQLRQNMFDGFAWDNYAEIFSMSDYNGDPANAKDADSTPRSNTTYENEVRPGDPFDDDIFGNGEGSGPNGEDEDEDDHDVAGPEIFDLAIRKERVSSPPSYSYTQEVEFEVIVFNQGNITGENIVIADYIPCGYELTAGLNPGWVWDSNTRIATYSVPQDVLPDETFRVSVNLDVNPCYEDQPNAWTNGCEIFMANNGRKDIDSTPDNINGNDNGGIAKSPSDNEIDGDANQGEDEDDHDVELAEVYDLAVKMIIVEGPPYDYGQVLTFRTWIYNQGNVIAENIVVRNDIPAGYTYQAVNNTTTHNPNPWDGNTTSPTILVNGPLIQGDSTYVDLKLRVIDAGGTPEDWYASGTINVSQDTVGVNRFDDADSLPGTDFDGETSVNPGDPEDDDIFFNSTLGFFQDQDDYDPAGFDVFDLALIKNTDLPGPFYVGNNIPFKIKVINQGGLVADNIVIGDTIPEGFIFNGGDNTGWSYNPGTRVATTTIPGPLGLGEMDSVEIILQVASATGSNTDWTNIAEIQAAREAVSMVGAIDFDSPMDTNFSNDVGGTPETPEDDHIDDNGSDFNMDGITDEDNHDPALVRVVDITHAKTFVSSTINPDGTYDVVYEIQVTNGGNAEGPYSLQDQPDFDDDIEILSASYSSNTPNGGSLPVSGVWDLASGQLIPSGGSHTYSLTVVVDLDLSEGSDGDNTYTLCGSGGQEPGLEGEGLFNRSLLDADDDGDIDEESTACGDLPYVDMEKNFVSTTLLGNGTYDVVYEVVVRNIGGRDGVYTLTDTPSFDDDITINSGSYSGTESGPMNTVGSTTLASNKSIGLDELHVYIITFNVSIDLDPDSNDGGDNEYTPCSNPGSDPGSNPGEGLYNKSELDRGSNGTVDVEDDACGDLPYLTMIKDFISATQLPNGNYTVVYSISVSNDGGVSDTYILTDTPLFDNDIIINSGNFSGQNSGPMNTVGSTTLASGEVINVGETHNYTITLDVTIDLETNDNDSGDNIYTSCSNPGSDPGSFPGEGLYNLAELDSGSDGNIDIEDDACGDLPYIVIDKTFISAIPLLDGTYDVTYEIRVDNLGGTVGNYRLTDTPQFDDDVVINSGNFSGQNSGPMNPVGSTQLANNELLAADAFHIYFINLNVTLDLEPGSTDGGDNVYNACSSPENEPGSNPGEGLYNIAKLDRGSDGNDDVEDDTCGDLPYVKMEKNFVSTSLQFDGSYNVVYEIIVRNVGGKDGLYTLTDTPDFDDDITINSGSFDGTESGPMNTSGSTTLANNKNIGLDEIHIYIITLNVSIDLEPGGNDGGDNEYTPCSVPGNESGSNPGEGLYNKAELDRDANGSVDFEDDACGDLPYLTMEKDFVSATQQLNGNYTVIYNIAVSNKGGTIETYTLTDTPQFDDDIVINSGSFSGQNSGPMNVVGSTTLASGESINVGATHNYTITLDVTIDLEPGSSDGGDNRYTPCSNPGNDPGNNPGEGLYNLAELDISDDGNVDIRDDACGDLPYVILDKTFVSAVPLLDGSYDVTYQIIVDNIGGAEGNYRLTDTPQFDDDVVINSGSYSGQNSGSMNTSGPTQLADNELIAAGATHVYSIELNVTLDLEPGSTDGGDNVYNACSSPENEPGSNPGEGLYNIAKLDRGSDGNDDVEDDTCGDLPYVDMDKTFLEAVQQNDGSYDVVYLINVTNKGGATGIYDLEDEPIFDDDITINNGSFSGQNNGVMNTSGTTQLATSESIIPGGNHVYTIVFNVTLDLDPDGVDGGDNIYTPCSFPGNDPGNNPGEGLYNVARLDRGSDGSDEVIDDACGDLPYVDMEKNLVSTTQLPNGTYDVVYQIIVTNKGGVAGNYSLSDTPLFDDDIVINSGSFSGQNSGPMNTTGSTQLANNESINEGETQLYNITLNVTIDLETNDNDQGDNQYSPCSNPGNDPGSNPGEGLYNRSELDRGSNGRIDVIDDACGDLPYVVIDKSFIDAVQLLDGSYDVQYQVIVENIGGDDGNYSLSDTPEFDDDIVINSGSFSGQNNGPMNTIGTTILASNEIIAAGQTHVYNITLNVTIDLEPGSPDGGDNMYTECSSPENEPGSNPGEGLYNKAELDRGSDGNNDVEDDTCGDLPYIVMEKNFVSADQLIDGSYNVTYEIDVTNIGGATGIYTLMDTPSFDDDVTINGGGFTIGLVCCGASAGNFVGDPGTLTFVTGSPLDPGFTDVFTITFNVTLDLEPGSPDGGDNIYTSCSNPGNDPGSNPGEGLYNLAELDRGDNGVVDIEDDACGDLPYVIMEKEFISAQEQPDGSFDVIYEIEVENIGGATGDYTLTDTPDFDDDITINSGNYSGQNNGPMNTVGSTTLASNESIAPGATHNYTILLNVTLDLSDANPDGGDNEYDPCSSPVNEPGSNPGEGLYNKAELDRGSDGNNDVEDDTCGDLEVTIGDFVWNDLDGDGIQDPGEPGIEDVTVRLYTCTGQLVASTQTNGSGLYEFDNLMPGCYYFEVSQPDGFEISLADQGGDDALDSDLTEANGPLTSSDYQIDKSGSIYDFAFIGSCITIGGEIWYDLNEDDMNNNGENGINGVPVLLYKRVEGQWVFHEETYSGPVPNTPSDDGLYKFCVLPGEYHIEFFMPPNSLVTVRANIGPDETIDSDVTGRYGVGTTDSYFISRDADSTYFCEIDAGYYPMGTAGDHVWIDVDGNGLRESLEPAAEGVLVEAFNIHDQKVAETTSDEYGRYRMEYLKKDPHYFRFTPPDGFGFTWSDPSNTMEDDIDSDVDHTNGPNTTQFYMMKPGLHTGHIDAGLSYASLPVEWLSFTGKNNGSVNLLEWSTTSEVNTLKYEVMRKSPLDLGFNVIGEVEAAGHSSFTLNYDFTDADITIDGTYYYKLRQVDKNGDYSFSDVVKIDVNLGSDVALAVYPNPTINYVNVQGIHQLSKIEMYDITGALIHQWNTGELSSSRLSLDQTIPTGNYLFKLIKTSGEAVDHQIMILNNR